MEVTIKINCDNAAFYDDSPSFEFARILRDLADRQEGNPHFSDGYSTALRDVNGNEIGYLSITGS